MGECRINKIEFNESPVRPAVVTFPSLQPQNVKDLQCELYKIGDGKYVYAAANEKTIYSGTVNRKEDCYNSFIAIKSRKSNKLRLISVDCVSLTPTCVKSINDTSKISQNTTVLQLQKEFGSKRTKRRLELQEKLKMNVTTVQKQLEETVADVAIKKADLVETVTENQNLYAPVINRDASNIEDVYKLESIIPNDVIDSLYEVGEEQFENSDFLSSLSPYVSKILDKLEETKIGYENPKYYVLLYVDCLIKFLINTAKSISSKYYESCEYSQIVSQHILDNFTIKTERGRLRPNSMKDKCMCYMLVLCMIISDFRLDLEILSKHIKVGVKKLLEVSRVLAFSPHPSKQKGLMTIKLPLPAPVISRKGKKT